MNCKINVFICCSAGGRLQCVYESEKGGFFVQISYVV